MVQEIHQVLMDREDTCHRTCFSLQLDGNVLDNFAELKSIEGLQEGSLLKVVEGEIRRLLFTLGFVSPSWCNMFTACKGLAVITLHSFQARYVEHF